MFLLRLVPRYPDLEEKITLERMLSAPDDRLCLTNP
jgi:hypothetical protein